MRIGISKEIKASESSVAITPSGVKALTHTGHDVFVEAAASLGSMISVPPMW